MEQREELLSFHFFTNLELYYVTRMDKYFFQKLSTRQEPRILFDIQLIICSRKF